MPKADPPKTIVFLLIIPFNVGVSPPPQDAIEISQAFLNPVIKSFILCSFSSQILLPIAQYACTTSGRAPTDTRSLIIVAIVSCAIAS